MIRLSRFRLLSFLPPTIVLAIVGGCASNLANIALRKQEQASRLRIETLERQHAADAATITAYQTANGSLQTLPQGQLDQLFTTHGLSLKRLTGGYDADPKTPGDDALKIYAVPTDDQNQPIKALGEFKVEAFVIGQDDAPLEAWTFSQDQARQAWLGDVLLYEFVLECPFKAPPKQAKLRVNVTFTDALTHRQFQAQKAITIQPG